jgi:hypothetical protein
LGDCYCLKRLSTLLTGFCEVDEDAVVGAEVVVSPGGGGGGGLIGNLTSFISCGVKGPSH